MLKVPQILKEKRLQKKLSLDDIAKATKIKVKFLEAIEKGDYNALPSSSYAQGFVRNYGQYLGFKASQIMPLFRREFDSETVFKVLPGHLAKKDDIPISRFKLESTAMFATIIFTLLIAYILFQYRFAFINPPLSVQSPKENSQIVAQEVDVLGKTDPNTTVYVNNSAVSVDSNGNFKKSINVFTGPTTIKIKSVSRFGKETEIDRHIIIVQPQ